MTRILVTLLVAAAPFSALADRAGAAACANALPAEARAIYEAAAPSVTPGTDLRALLQNRTRALMAEGRVAQSSARRSATAAGGCLQQLQ